MAETTTTNAEAEEPEGVELSFPIEFFILDEVPVSLSGKPASINRWKHTVETAARASIDASSWATDQPVSVTIFYFPEDRMQGDVDNIVKPILDAMKPFIYIDDRQVERVWVQKFEPDRPALVANDATITLASALDNDTPILYIRIDDDGSLGV